MVFRKIFHTYVTLFFIPAKNKSKSSNLYSDDLLILTKRIGVPLNVNSRSEYGILHGGVSKTNNLSKAHHSEREDLTLVKTKPPRHSSLDRQKQTNNNPLRWKLSPHKRQKSTLNESHEPTRGYKSTCCVNKNPSFRNSKIQEQSNRNDINEKRLPPLHREKHQYHLSKDNVSNHPAKHNVSNSIHETIDPYFDGTNILLKI